jgi:hypothetical protein
MDVAARIVGDYSNRIKPVLDAVKVTTQVKTVKVGREVDQDTFKLVFDLLYSVQQGTFVASQPKSENSEKPKSEFLHTRKSENVQESELSIFDEKSQHEVVSQHDNLATESRISEETIISDPPIPDF